MKAALAVTALAAFVLPAADAFACGPLSAGLGASQVGARAGAAGGMCLTMKAHGASRRDLLFSATAAAAAVFAPQPASAQFPSISFDAKGDRPAGLGPQGGGRFLSLCDSANCVCTSDDVYSKRFLPPWTYNDEGKKPKTQPQVCPRHLLPEERGSRGGGIGMPHLCYTSRLQPSALFLTLQFSLLPCATSVGEGGPCLKCG